MVFLKEELDILIISKQINTFLTDFAHNDIQIYATCFRLFRLCTPANPLIIELRTLVVRKRTNTR